MVVNNVFIADSWKDYKIIDAGNGEKLESWGSVTVIRPDPQIIWPRTKSKKVWQQCHMHYHRSKSGGGHWENLRESPGNWTITYDVRLDDLTKEALTFNIRPTDFKHMGLFPEQAANWQWAMNLIREAKRPIRLLNLFGYTGGATVCCLKAGAKVTHVDAAKGMNQWAKDNIKASGLEKYPCRILTDDVYKFVQRELRRESFYDAIILDPPSYGRGPSGEVWKLENLLYDLLENCVTILSDKPLFMLLNTYTTGFTAVAAENVMKLALGRRDFAGNVTSAPLGLPIESDKSNGEAGLILPCGMSVRWVF